jgi:hypothetical protein
VVHEAREVAYGGAQQFVGKRLKVTMIILLFSLSALLFEIHDQDFWWVLPHYLGFFFSLFELSLCLYLQICGVLCSTCDEIERTRALAGETNGGRTW